MASDGRVAGGLERVPEQAPQSGAQLGSSQGSKSDHSGKVTIAGLAQAAKDAVLAGVLHQARLLSSTDSAITLAFESEFIADQVRERMPALRATLQALGVGAVAVEIVVGALPATGAELPGRETLIEVEQRKLDEDREKRRQEALAHPARKMIDARFGGTWKDPVVDMEKE
jgi:hypothetical protein